MREELQQFCQSIGLDTIGFIPCREFDELTTFYNMRKEKGLQNEFEEQSVQKRISPRHYMPEAKTIISIAFPYNRGEDLEDNGFSVYTKRSDYHRVVKKYLDQICEYIEQRGGKAVGFVDSNTLPERYIAYLAGIGFIGRNNMLITKTYGSYVFLGEVITDLEIACDEKRCFDEIAHYAECGACQRCITACPTKSINKSRINPNRCVSYMTQKKELSDQEMRLLNGNIFGCDTCQLGCPYNEAAKPSSLPEFDALPDMDEEAHVYAGMNNQYFKDKISVTSCGWRGKNVIKRNAIMRLADEGQDIQQYKGDSPYINHYIERLSE
ncbi:MAG: tRNA epoxyqueuosine(34) reductase QueG [Cellulosilyticaceae bacterium]